MLVYARPAAAQPPGNNATPGASGQPAADSNLLQDNIVVLLDTSGSMAQWFSEGGDTRMNAAKKALQEVLQQVPETTNVGILIFGR